MEALPGDRTRVPVVAREGQSRWLGFADPSDNQRRSPLGAVDTAEVPTGPRSVSSFGTRQHKNGQFFNGVPKPHPD